MQFKIYVISKYGGFVIIVIYGFRKWRMKMHGKPRTKKQAYRIQLIKEELGCLACHIEGFGYVPCDYHHADDQKQDHDRGYGLCPWHHRGWVYGRMTEDLLTWCRGPSKAVSSKAFTAKYGSEQQLLDLQNERIREWEKNSVNSANYVKSNTV